MTIGRYVLVQLVAYGVDFGSFLLVLAALPIGPLVANVVGKLAAALFAFALHRRYTFIGAAEGSRGRQGVLYFLLLGLNIPLSSAVLAVLLPMFPLPAAAKFASDVICVALTYLISKHLVFVRRNGKAQVRRTEP